MTFIAVDWGTSNRRAYVVEDGMVVREREDDQGILKIARDGFAASHADFVEDLGDLPVLMAGMVGSNRGWVDAPYCPAPAGLGDLAGRIQWVEPGRIGIVPGVSFRTEARADVMRGEETQLLGGVAAGTLPADGLVCHPGTHNKWVELRDGRIVAFRTVMTGEAFALFRGGGILADWLKDEPDAGSKAFAAGVAHGLVRDDLLSELFATRARVLLGDAGQADVPSYVSGLLCGGDIRIGLADWPDTAQVHVVGRPSLTALTATGLRLSGRHAAEVDGETALIAGLATLAETVLR